MKITQIISDCLLNHSVYILIHKKRKEEKGYYRFLGETFRLKLSQVKLRVRERNLGKNCVQCVLEFFCVFFLWKAKKLITIFN